MMVPIQLSYFTFCILFLVGTFFYFFDSKTTFPIKNYPITTELHGNFLHITDFHPDPYYVSNVTVKSRCHGRFQENKRPKRMKRGISGPWGSPTTVCDSPLGLIDATFEWLERNWKNKIDFVIWTGDNVRHDNDDNVPRTHDEIIKSNRMIVEKFLKTFGDTNNLRKKHGPRFIPIIPSIGNNDIHPNNIVFPGPNNILKLLYDAWSPFIPKGQHKSFINGGYFYNEVIPNKLLVISLNTLYFYKANTAVNGCRGKSQAGTIEMRWLNDVLKRAKKKGMKVYLTGHVAPRTNQYTKSCYKIYGRLALKYNDIILGHFYGHSNMDHFFFINARSVRKRRVMSNDDDNDDDIFMDDEDTYDDDDDDDNDDDDDDDDDENYEDQEVVKNGDDKYIDENETLELENQKEQTLEIPPSDEEDEGNEDGKVEAQVRNIDRYMNKLLKHYSKVFPRSRQSGEKFAVIHINPSIIPTFFPALRIFKYNTTHVTKNITIDTTDTIDSTTRRRKHPTNAPSLVNTFLTPLGYTQYFINLTHANLFPNITPNFTIEYTTWDNYHMNDLTIPSWTQLAQKIANRGFKSSLWKKIQDHLMVGTKSLIRRKKRKHYEYSGCRVKGPEDYLSEL